MAHLGVISTARQAQFNDGRRMAFAEFGDPRGTPVFLFHGVPGCRLYRHPNDTLTASLGIRLIVPDRPGFGLSDAQPGRVLLDYPDDVAALAATLKISQFAVVGHAAGGLYAAACAYKLAPCVTRAAIVSGLPPANSANDFAQLGKGIQRLYRFIRNMPGPAKFAMRVIWRLCNAQSPEKFTQRMIRSMPSAQDQILFAEKPFYSMLQENIEETRHSGVAGYWEEMRLHAENPGFHLQDIRIPVDLWWGAADQNIPPCVGGQMDRTIPTSTLHIVPDAGHYVIFSRWQEILSKLS